MKRWLVFAVLLLSIAATALPAQASPPKIQIDPATFTLTPGSQRQVSFQLDEPIICPNMTDCRVTLSLADFDGGGLVPNPGEVSWAADQWREIRTATFYLDASANLADGTVRSKTLPASSTSEYYRNYLPTLRITVSNPATQQQVSTGVNAGQASQSEATTKVAAQSSTASPSMSSIPSDTPTPTSQPEVSSNPPLVTATSPENEDSTGGTILMWILGFAVVGAAATVTTIRIRLHKKLTGK